MTAPMIDVTGAVLPEAAHARHTDPDTSHAAAASITTPALRASQAAVLDALRGWPTGLCFNDLITWYADHRARGGWPLQSPSGIRTRVRELVTAGLVRDTGDRVALPSGRQAIVWAVIADG